MYRQLPVFVLIFSLFTKGERLCVFLATSLDEVVLPNWPRGYKNILTSTLLSMKFVLLINLKIPTFSVILTFISK